MKKIHFLHDNHFELEAEWDHFQDLAKQLFEKSPDEYAPDLHQFLLHLKKSHLSLEKRLYLLEYIHEQTHTQWLATRQVAQNIGASPILQQKQTQRIDLLQHAMAVAYLQLIIEYPDKMIHAVDLKIVSLSLYRAITYLQTLQLWYAQCYFSMPERLWIHMHSIYKTAVRHNLHHYKLSSLSRQLPESSIENFYKSALLFSIANTSRLTIAEMPLLQSCFNQWASHTQIHTHGNFADLYGISLINDEGPRYQTLFKEKPESPDYLTFDTTPLVNYLNPFYENTAQENSSYTHIHNHVNASGNTSDHVGINIERTLLKNILINLSQKPTRRYPRFTEHGPILLKIKNPSDPVHASVFECTKQNKSENGYALTQSAIIRPMSIGEEIQILDADDNDHWKNAIIRWLKYDKQQGMQIGIQLI